MRCARMSPYVILCAVLASLLACRVDTSPTPNGTVLDGGGHDPMDGGADGRAPDGGGNEPPSLLDGPLAERTSTLMLEQEVASVQLAGEHAIGLLAISGLALLDVRDARAPSQKALMATVGRVVAIQYDHARQIAFALTESGDLRAFRLTDPSAPVRVGTAQLTIPADGALFLDLARAGDRLFALTSRHIVPVDVELDAQSGVTMVERAPVDIADGALHIAQSGTGLLIAFEGGIVRSFTAVAAPALVDEASLGAEILDWSVRGERVLVALAGVGLRAIWLRPGDPADVLLRASELDDAVRIARSGQLVAAVLARGRIALLDFSDIERPRGVAVHTTEPPAWVSVAHGNLLIGSGQMVHVIGVPPFLEAGVAAHSRQAAPRHGRFSLRFSKPIDPGSVTLESVVMRCGGRVVPLIPQLDLERRSVTVLPTEGLPGDTECTIELRRVRDDLGLTASARPELITFTTRSDGGPVQNGPSVEPHTAEGRMTGFSLRAEDGFEYGDLEPARGEASEVYADYDGQRLWLFFDTFELIDPLYPDCGAVFSGVVASGAKRFVARVFGDQRVVVEGAEAIGGYAYGATRGSRDPHAAFELAIESEPGGFAIQAYLPSFSRGCEHVEREPVVWSGMCDEDGCTLDGSGAVEAPAMADSIEPGETDDVTPTIRFDISNERMSLPESAVAISTQGDTGRTIYRATAYARTLTVPSGVLSAGRYDVRITVHNVAGIAPAAESELSIATTCEHVECLPGAALDPGCSRCARDVCSLDASCCDDDEMWGNACVVLASDRCECNAPTLASLSPDTGAAGERLDVAVAVTDSAPSLEHTLLLAPEAGGEGIEVPCAFDGDAVGACTAAIPGTLLAGRYAASIRISAGGAAHTTEAIAGALTLTP